MGRRSVSSDLLRNIELLVGVALPLFLTGVWLQDHLTGSGHWAHPLESAFFEWLSLVPVLVFVGLLHSVAVAVIASVWPRAANRLTVLVGAVLMLPLLVAAGRPAAMLARYAAPLVVALVVYTLASRIPGGRAPPDEAVSRAPLGEDELRGRAMGPLVMPSLEHPPPPVDATPRARPPSSEAR
jgi:hypothetical protein